MIYFDLVMKIELCLLTLLHLMLFTNGGQISSRDVEEWKMYKMKFDKTYETQEEDYRRMKIFLAKKIKIEQHNILYYNGSKTFKLGINKFSDLNSQELTRKRKRLLGGPRRSEPADILPLDEDLPDSVDWRLAGAVTGVKDQGQCGACYAFAASGALEAQHFLETGHLVPLSEQNLIDCSKEVGNLGCNGGWVDLAFEYVKRNNGVHTAESYPFRGKEGECRKKTSPLATPIRGFVDLPVGQERALQAAVARVGPVAVRIDAQDSFAGYVSGVYFGEDCSPLEHNHAALVVGYDADSWFVKNSWGEDWGEGGYVRMARDKANNCGIASAASYPVVW